ncbi:peptidylprolyl isomerase [Tissierella creatinini]|nr:peptidylprolyl isomerase [Tissierella creatinini]TJX63707.1 peptidylprolyl isomerase [Soehngenia saccharolytica]
MFLLIKIKKNWAVLILALTLSMTLSACTKNTEGLVGSVDGQDITQAELDADYEVFKSLYERELGEDALEQTGQDGISLGESLKDSILEKLIMEKLIAKESEKLNISISNEDLDEAVQKSINDMGGQESFDEFLESMNITKDFYASNLKKELLVQKHKDEFLKTITITDDEAKDFFEENKDQSTIVRASHILVATEDEGKEVLQRLANGEDFATLATLESLDSVSAANGGDLNYFGRGKMIAEFEEVAFALEEGETSELVKTEVGYHIIRLTEKKDTYEELKTEITNLLKEKKYLEKVQELRDESKVEKYLDSSK